MSAVREGTAEVNGIRMHFLTVGEGPPVVLLHGWPETSLMWRHVLPALNGRHTLIAPDLRGYGRTDAPPAGYDKRTMAEDVRGLVRALGHERVAHRWALDYPEEVERVAFLDIVPTREVVRRFDATLAGGFWHWLFHFQPDLPERLVGGREREYLEFFFERWSWRRSALDDAVDAYVRAFSRPGRLRAGFEDYRATLTADLPADEESFTAGCRLQMPVLVLWGAQGLVSALPVCEVWARYADDVRAEAVPDCGHFLAEEKPEQVGRLLADFLDAR
jgi:haloacetate dehalogenase